MGNSAGDDYFSNHDRRQRFPWSLYHAELARRIARVVAAHGKAPRVLLVGCGLETSLTGAPPGTELFACDLDARAIAACRERVPERAASFEVSPGPYELPASPPFDAPFDVVIAKEVIEHTDDPVRFARALAARSGPGGELVLTTPNYGRFSSLPILESTVLEWIARRDGFSRKHIHPTRFDLASFSALDVGPSMTLALARRSITGWSLFGRWRRVGRA